MWRGTLKKNCGYFMSPSLTSFYVDILEIGILPVKGLLFERFHVIFIVFLCPCYISHSVHKENPTRCNSVSGFLLFHIYMKLNMFRVTYHPSSGA